jgi:hypothetical protein
VQRSQLMMVSAQEVEQASNQQYQQMVAEARRKNALDRDPATVQRVRRIVSRLDRPKRRLPSGCAVVVLGGARLQFERAQRLVHGRRQDGDLHRAHRTPQR